MAKQSAILTSPWVSVIIPTLNEQDYISDILQDLYHQTRQPDKIIVVDGHSSDNTQALIKIWAQKWHKVELLIWW